MIAKNQIWMKCYGESRDIQYEKPQAINNSGDINVIRSLNFTPFPHHTRAHTVKPLLISSPCP